MEGDEQSSVAEQIDVAGTWNHNLRRQSAAWEAGKNRTRALSAGTNNSWGWRMRVHVAERLTRGARDGTRVLVARRRRAGVGRTVRDTRQAQGGARARPIKCAGVVAFGLRCRVCGDPQDRVPCACAVPGTVSGLWHVSRVRLRSRRGRAVVLCRAVVCGI